MTTKERSFLMDDNIRRYADDISKVVILDAKTEKELVKKYKKNGDPEAKRRLVESGLRFVITLARRYAHDLEHHKTLILAGNEGLVVAVDRYKLGKGTRFLSYAAWWVLLYIREEAQSTRVVQIPTWRKKAARKVKEAQDKILSMTGKNPTAEAINQETALTESQIASVLANDFIELSIHDEAGSLAESDFCYETQVEEACAAQTSIEILQYILNTLPARDKFILQAYYGFITPKPMSLKQIATVMNLSSERVRQIKMEALDVVKSILSRYDIEGLEDILP